MNSNLKVISICAIFSIQICTAENISSKNSLAGLVGSQNDAHFGKSFFLLVDSFQHLVYGHADEIFDFTFWFGNVTCPKEPSEVCDIRACGGVPDAKVYCQKSENPEKENSICKCQFPSSYPQTCGQPKLVLDIDMHYYEKDDSPQSDTSVATLNFIAACTMSGDDKLPETPEPEIKISQDPLSNGNDGLQVSISITQYVQVPGLPVYFWTTQTILIQINKTSLAMFLGKIEGIEHLVEMIKDL